MHNGVHDNMHWRTWTMCNYDSCTYCHTSIQPTNLDCFQSEMFWFSLICHVEHQDNYNLDFSKLCFAIRSYWEINGKIICKIFMEDETTDGRSLIYKTKSKGPRIEPCGTPDRTGNQSEAQPLITKHFVQ